MKRDNKSIATNAILNVIRQGLNVLFPLITYPYILRVLGVETVGKVNYSSSIIGYFSLIAMLGITNYAIREGARLKKDREAFERFASQILSINMLSTAFAYILLCITLVIFKDLKSYKDIILLQSLSIVLTTVGVDWINSVYEDYLLLTIRSIITNIVSLILTFLLIRGPNDYMVYAFLAVLTNGIVCVTNYIYCRRYASLKVTYNLEIRKHIKPMMILFANAIAVTIYVNIDTTMLGFVKGDYAVGLYSAAVKVYTIAKNVMAAIYVVSVPRLSLYAGEENWERYKSLCTDILVSLSKVLIPIGIGLVCLSNEIITIIGGSSYSDASTTLGILGLSLIFAIYGGFFTAALNITLRRERITLYATLLSAMVNIVLNCIFIPHYGHNGAALTTLISELIVLLFTYGTLRNKTRYIEVNRARMALCTGIIGSIVVAIMYMLSNYIAIAGTIRVLFVTASSILVYALLLYINKDELILKAIGFVNSALSSVTNEK